MFYCNSNLSWFGESVIAPESVGRTTYSIAWENGGLCYHTARGVRGQTELSERNFFVGSLGKRAAETLVGGTPAGPARAEVTYPHEWYHPLS